MSATISSSCCSTTNSGCNTAPPAVAKSCCSSKQTPNNKNNYCNKKNANCCSDDVQPSTSTVVATTVQNKSTCCSSDSSCNNIPIATKSCCDMNDITSGCCSSNNRKNKAHVCLAVLRPDNSALDVFDASGKAQQFILRNKRHMKDISDKEICFATHSGKTSDNDIDMMATPCFNDMGYHDEPSEICPCGEEEAHIHAHIYNPDICDVDDCCMTDATRKKATNWNFLSQLTFYMNDNSSGSGSKAGHIHMPITENLPSECNSKVLRSSLNERGLKLSHWLHWRNSGILESSHHERSCRDNIYCGENCKDCRMYPIQHEDHVDFLIHNEETGALHLEHPNCASCGENDIHGRFCLMHTRSWITDKGGSKIKLHFFQVHDEPFRLLDVLAGFFELESSRVNVTRPLSAGMAADIEKEMSTRVGRSTLYIKDGLCCASEVPQIESILLPLDTVDVISVNPTTKRVIVEHNVDIIAADALCSVLSSQGFMAVIVEDAAVALDQKAGIPTDIYVDSAFDLSSVLKGTAEDDRSKVGEVIQACLAQKYTQKEITNVTVDEQEKLTVCHNPYYLTAPSIVDALASLMYEVHIISDGGADGKWALSALIKSDTEETIEQQHSTVRWTVVASGVLWLISMLSFIGGNWEYLKYVALLSVAFGLPPIAVKAFRTMRRFHFDVNCMMLFAALGALPLQEYTESAAVTFLFAISEALEQRATARARNALSALVCLRPEYANIINPVTNSIVVLPANCVAVGSSVSVAPGDKIPCDGVVTEGKSAIDESSLTGESRPVNKSVGAEVSGGTINIGACRLVVKTTATSNNSMVSRLIRLIEEAQSNRSGTEKLVDSFAAVYTPVVVLLALSMCTFPWIVDKETGAYWAKTGLITLVIACPCALIISTPVSYVAALAACSQKGVIVKGGEHLESLGRVKTIAFDKTGTLSEGVFQLLHFNVVGNTRSRKDVLGYLALVEAPASHPLSDALVKGAMNEQVIAPKLTLSNHTLLPGEGITANVAGKAVHVGNTKLFTRLNMYDDLPDNVKAKSQEWAKSGGTTGYISIEGEGIVGAYCVADKIREETKDVVHTLKCMGIKINMLTGDQRPAALGIGNQIELNEEDIKSELLPEDKLAAIHEMVDGYKKQKKCSCQANLLVAIQEMVRSRETKKVMMVGDGVNDAPALAMADISVAMGEGGAALAMDTSDVVLIGSDLTKLLFSIRMGRRVIRTIIQNVIFSLAVKAIVMGFAFAGKATLWAAIVSDVGAMLLVTLNGMKLLPSSRKVKNNDLARASNDNESAPN